MKLIIIHITGLATEALEELEGRTLLEAADVAALDAMARNGACGTARLLPEGTIGGPGAEFLGMMGGLRQSPDLPSLGALEALGIGAPLYARDIAFRVNLSSLDDDGVVANTTGAGLPEQDMMTLMEEIDRRLSTRRRNFYPGRYFAHLMVWTDGPTDLRCVAAPEACGKSLEDVMPVGDGDGPLGEFIWDSVGLLNDHRINHERREEGLAPVNLIWPWAPGRLPEYRNFALNTGLSAGALARRFDVLGAAKALGIGADVPGHSVEALRAGLTARAAESALAYLHVDAREYFEHPDEPETHVSAVTGLDTWLVGPVLEAVRASAEATRLVVIGTQVDSSWAERPPAIWAAFPALQGRGAVTDIFSEAAVTEEGLALDEPDRIFNESMVEPG